MDRFLWSKKHLNNKFVTVFIMFRESFILKLTVLPEDRNAIWIRFFCWVRKFIDIDCKWQQRTCEWCVLRLFAVEF